MRALIVGVDWHGDVAPTLCAGLRALDIDATVRYVVRQRRSGVLPRLEDELRATERLGPRLRRRRERGAIAETRAAIEEVAPTLTVCLCPELMPAAAVEALSASSEVRWWFADNPFSPARRGLAGAPPALDHIARHGGRSFVAHPDWARGPLAPARYLPYASRYEAEAPAYLSTPGRRCVVVGSPRPERAELLAGLRHALGGDLEVWGWGPRGRLPRNRATRPFRSSLRGWRVLSAERVASIYRSAAVVLNLQDRQMLGAWNPQTFDLMGIGARQVAWNREPVDYLENPPPSAATVDGLVELVRRALDTRRRSDDLEAALEEVRRRHLWRHRAEAIAVDG